MVGSPGVTEELCGHFENHGTSTVAVMEVPQADVTKYGMVKVTPQGDRLQIHNVVEKPNVSEAPSRWALPGRYVFENETF